jgi:ketosteroid isomerase-like protein
VSVAGEKNKALVRRFHEVLTEGDPEAIRELLAPDFVDHRPIPGYEDPGREGYSSKICCLGMATKYSSEPL